MKYQPFDNDIVPYIITGKAPDIKIKNDFKNSFLINKKSEIAPIKNKPSYLVLTNKKDVI